jgi:membrane-associated phospholipid phosphatase
MDFLVYLQSYATPALDIFFQGITLLGEDNFLIVMAVAIYWCYDKRLGFRLGVLYCLSLVLNNVIKEAVKAPRPIGMEGIRSLSVETATGYSFPSGHTQGVTTFWTALAQGFHRRWLYVVALAVITLVGFSRLYLGVHYPEDVLWGAVFGIAVTVLAGPALNALENNRPALWKFCLVPAAAIAAALLFASGPELYKACGALAGLFTGRLADEKFIQFEAEGGILFNLLKFAAGMAVLLAIKEGLKMALPAVPASDFTRYLAVGIWASAGAPWFFTRMRR